MDAVTPKLDLRTLIDIDAIDPEKVFSPGGTDAVIAQITERAKAEQFDISTRKGRDHCKSVAYLVSRACNELDRLGKEYVAVIKEKPKKIDAERKKARESLGSLSISIREPVTRLEEAEEARVAAHEAELAKIVLIGQYPIADAAPETIRQYREQINGLSLRNWEEFEKRAIDTTAEIAERLDRAIEAAEKREADRKELEELRRKLLEQEQLERERKAAQEAAEKATREAEEKAAREARAAEEAATAEREHLERERQEAEERAANAEREAKEAANRLERERLEAVEAERRRVAQAEAEAKAAAEVREADARHRESVNTAIKTALAEFGITDNVAGSLIAAIAEGSIPNVFLKY